MILWDYKCSSCRRVEERLVSHSELESQRCSHCEVKMDRLFASRGYDGGYERRRFPMYDESLDAVVQSKQHKKQLLKERGLIQIDGHFTRGGVKKDKMGVIYSFGR